MLQVFMGRGQKKTNVSAATTDIFALLEVLVKCKKLNVPPEANKVANKVKHLSCNGRFPPKH